MTPEVLEGQRAAEGQADDHWLLEREGGRQGGQTAGVVRQPEGLRHLG